MQSTCLIFAIFVFFGYIAFSSTTTYYAIKLLRQEKTPLLGSISSYNPKSTNFRSYSNFSFHINDNDTYLYYFYPGPIAVSTNRLSTIYFPLQCGTSFQRLFLISYNMLKKTYKQSPWILNYGGYRYLHYDPLRQRLFGLRDETPFSVTIEEYNITKLNVVKEYTKQDGDKYGYPGVGRSIFDYQENWIVEVRSKFEYPLTNAYFMKMDLNLVGKKQDIVTEYRLLPNIHNLCTITYDIKSKTALVTWQNGSMDQDIVMMYMNPYTGKFQNKRLLFKTGSGYAIRSIKAVYNEEKHQILFAIEKQTETHDKRENWMIIVDFYTMKIIDKKQIDSTTGLEYWEFFAV